MSSTDFFNYGSVGIFAGTSAPYSPNTETLGSTLIHGVQSSSVTLDYPRSDIMGWDENGDQVLLQRPRAELFFSYIFASGINESSIGLMAFPSGVAPALDNINQERNYYVAYNEDSRDIVGSSPADCKIMAFGNGLLSRYDFNASIGQPTLVTATIQALNLLIQPSGSGQVLPAVSKRAGDATTGRYSLPIPSSNPISDYFESRPSSITLTFDTGCAVGVALSGQTACPLQSFGFSIDLPRAESKHLGWAYPEYRPVVWPATISMSATAYLTDPQEDALNRFGCPDSGMDFSVGFKNGCSSLDPISFVFKGAKLTSQSFRNQIGSLSQVSLNWSLKIFDINRDNQNFYIYNTGAYYSSIIFPDVQYVAGSSPLTFNLSTPSFLKIMSGPATLSGNYVSIWDEGSSVVVRAVATDGSDAQDLIVST